MKEEASSSASWRAKRNLTAETSSDSFDDCNFKNFPASKRLKHHEHNNASNKSVLMMKFKGVVPQQNGHWGAQIYANHRRIWLGTFKSEKEAAMAYDSATIKLRSRDSHRNFPWTDRTIQEPSFQRQYSTEGILHMIRDGSYQLQFAEFLRAQTQREEHATSPNDDETRVHGERRFSCIQLFQKELTPSDVGKLNRLVIPKKFAVKYFPYFPENGEDDAVLGGGVVVVNDIELAFYDRMMKLWRFRYCYWRSSQSFVFTRGWNRFVKEKNLKEKDIVTFYTCGVKEGQQFALIDITYSNGTPPSCVVDEVSQIEEKQKELELNLGCKFRRNNDDKELMIDEDKVLMRGMEYKDNVVNEKGIVRLFGVQIK